MMVLKWLESGQMSKFTEVQFTGQTPDSSEKLEQKLF